MTPLNMPLPNVQKPPSAAEASAAKKALADESNANFKETLDDVSANNKQAETNRAKSQELNSQEIAKKAERKEAAPEPEAAKAEINNRKERSEEIKKSRKHQDKVQTQNKSREEQPDFAAIPEAVVVVAQQPLAASLGAATPLAGMVAEPQKGINPGQPQAAVMLQLDEVMQVVRGGGVKPGQSGRLDPNGMPAALRSPASRTGQPTPQINKAPLSAQSPKFSQELAERVGNLRLISRAGVSDQVRINLVPRDLGNLDIRLQVDGENRVHMMVTAESDAVKDLLKSQMSQLKESLIKQGMEFGDVDIQVDVQQREDGAAGTRAELEWGGDGRFTEDGKPGSDGLLAEDGQEEAPIMGKVVRSSDGGMSVFI